MKVLQKITVTELQEPIRLNTYCEHHVDYFESRKSVKKGIARGEVLLNENQLPGGTWLKNGDVITIIDLENKPPKPYHLVIPVVYEDNYIAVVHKPAGLTVSGNQFKTLYNALGYNLKTSLESNALNWPLPTHRIDNQTQGLVLIAKTKTARIALGDMFENNEIFKTYYAIVMGQLTEKYKKHGIIKSAVDSKEAETLIEEIAAARSLKNNWLTLLKVSPKTGRTHQIRKHLSEIGNPILGDKLYGGKTIKHKGLFLCASTLAFIHPITEESMHVSIPIPKKFLRRIESEHKRWMAFNGDTV